MEKEKERNGERKRETVERDCREKLQRERNGESERELKRERWLEKKREIGGREMGEIGNREGVIAPPLPTHRGQGAPWPRTAACDAPAVPSPGVAPATSKKRGENRRGFGLGDGEEK